MKLFALLVAMLATVAFVHCSAEEFAVTSCEVTVDNKTNMTLNLFGDCAMSHGIFKDSAPTAISAQGTGYWKAESDGSGWTEGTCTYTIGTDMSQSVKIYFDVPTVGQNSYIIEVTSGAPYAGSYSGGSGYSAEVTFTLAAV